MTRRDYVQMAVWFNQEAYQRPKERQMILQLAYDFAIEVLGTNPNFDINKFLMVVGDGHEIPDEQIIIQQEEVL